ncbi:MAG: hypothetical protein K940chlam2_01569 [Chlamydiae bacterium]|nr:hypothetical protein [Chlamydiota bacterium]
MAQTQVIDNRFAAESSGFTRVTKKAQSQQNKELLKIAAELMAIKAVLEGTKPAQADSRAPAARAPAPRAPAPRAPAPAPPKKGGRVNPILLLYEAVGRSQDSESQQQITDSKTAEVDVAREEVIYDYWNENTYWYKGKSYNGMLGWYAAHVAYYASKGKKYAGDVTEWQTTFNEKSSTAQAAEGQSDGAVQSAQNQTSGDASNNQKMVQMIGTINTILSTTAQLLAQGLIS